MVNVNIRFHLAKLLDIHNRTLYDKDKKYDCKLCGHQVSKKNNLARHKKIVHEGVKFPCGQCNCKTTDKGNLALHKRAVHEGVKYTCELCNYQTSQ